jgi:DNA-binding NarL/FixJ family response regulator
MAMSNQPDIVLMDINLEGGREGIETARWLRSVCDTPILFVTGYTDPDTIDRIHEQVPGAWVLSKMIYRDSLAAAVAAVAGRPH